MDAMQMQQMNEATARRRAVEKQALHRALERVEDDTFGICDECGDDINPKRLEIDLTLTLCITCASEKER